jgi:regulatory protein
MKITDINPTKRGRYAIFGDGVYIDSVDDETLVISRIKVGTDIDEFELEKLLAESKKKKAKDKALRLLSLRDHSRAELIQKLQRSTDEEAAEQAASRMEQLGLIDDTSFAKKYASELILHKLYGRERAIYEMLRKGLDKEIVLQAIDNIETEPQEQILKLLNKKYPRGINDESDFRKASAFLNRYGYKWDEIKQALESYGTEEQDAD